MRTCNNIRRCLAALALIATTGGGIALAFGPGLPGAASEAAAALPAPPARLRAEGRLVARPGAEVAVGTEIGGRVVAVPVVEKARVRRGDLLVEIDAAETIAALDAARADLAQARAEREFRVRDLARVGRMDRAARSEQSLEQAERDFALASARCEGAAAAIRRLEAAVAKARVLAPIDGAVLARHIDPGETVDAGRVVLEIADLERLWIEVEVDEFDAARVALGAAVEVAGEGWPGAAWRGRVEEIPDHVVPRRVRQQDPAMPSDTRVLRVKVALLERSPLRLGQRVEVAIGAAEAAPPQH